MIDGRPSWRVQLTARRLTTLLGDWEGGVSVYRALADRIRLLVVDGRVPVGTRLPSERELAAELGRSRSTVVAAYELLRDGGYVRRLQGSGTVAAMPSRSASVPPPAAYAVDFSCALPLAVDGLADAVGQAMQELPRVLGRQELRLRGTADLREAVAARYTARGLPTDASQVMITLGAQHAIHLAARLLVRPGDRVLMETPLYPHAYDAFRDAGARIVTTPVTRSGWDGEHLMSALERHRPAAALLLPDFQNPTAASMPPALRREVADAANRLRTTLVVDETTGELDIERGWDDGPMARYAGDAITIGSLSKTVWAGLRIGWIRAEADTIDRLVRVRPSLDLGNSTLDQLVAARMVPRLDDLLPQRSAGLRAHRDLLLSELRDAVPEWDVPTVDGGLGLWIGLGEALSSSLALVAQARGVLLSAGPRYSVDGSYERFLRLPFTLPRADLIEGVHLIADAWRELSGRSLALGDERVPAVV